MIQKDTQSNIILIGMPGSGKSTIGRLVAEKKSLHFLDTDELIQNAEQQTLQNVFNTNGYEKFLIIEERMLVSLQCNNSVIATGGSAIYCEKAMKHLKKNGIVIFLYVDYTNLVQRINNFESRGIALKPEQTFKELFQERDSLYHTYADITIDCVTSSKKQITEIIIKKLDSYSTRFG